MSDRCLHMPTLSKNINKRNPSINHSNFLVSQKLSSPLDLFRLKSFHGFVILGRTMDPIACFVFYLVLKMWIVIVWKIFTKRPLSIMVNSIKGYLCYKTITPQNVLSEAQVESFFIS